MPVSQETHSWQDQEAGLSSLLKGWRDSIVCRKFALYVADPGFILDILYGPISTSKSEP